MLLGGGNSPVGLSWPYSCRVFPLFVRLEAMIFFAKKFRNDDRIFDES